MKYFVLGIKASFKALKQAFSRQTHMKTVANFLKIFNYTLNLILFCIKACIDNKGMPVVLRINVQNFNWCAASPTPFKNKILKVYQ